jgi:hypothetical protein
MLFVMLVITEVIAHVYQTTEETHMLEAVNQFLNQLLRSQTADKILTARLLRSVTHLVVGTNV